MFNLVISLELINMYFLQMFTGIMANYYLCIYGLSSGAGNRINNPDTTNPFQIALECVCQQLNCVRLFVTPWIVAHQILQLRWSRVHKFIRRDSFHHLSSYIPGTSASYLFSYKQPWTVNPNNSFSNEDTEVSDRKMCVDSTSQQQKRYWKQSLDRIHCLYADTQYLIQ